MSERLGNLGYLMMGKETTKGTPVIPSIAVPDLAVLISEFSSTFLHNPQ
jgi:hypothetical protein